MGKGRTRIMMGGEWDDGELGSEYMGGGIIERDWVGDVSSGGGRGRRDERWEARWGAGSSGARRSTRALS